MLKLKFVKSKDTDEVYTTANGNAPAEDDKYVKIALKELSAPWVGRG